MFKDIMYIFCKGVVFVSYMFGVEGLWILCLPWGRIVQLDIGIACNGTIVGRMGCEPLYRRGQQRLLP